MPLRVSNPDAVKDKKKKLKYTPCVGQLTLYFRTLFRKKEKIHIPLFYTVLKCFIGKYN